MAKADDFVGLGLCCRFLEAGSVGGDVGELVAIDFDGGDVSLDELTCGAGVSARLERRVQNGNERRDKRVDLIGRELAEGGVEVIGHVAETTEVPERYMRRPTHRQPAAPSTSGAVNERRRQLAARGAGGASVPAASVPVPAQVDRVGWHGDDVSDAALNVTVAAGTEVGLRGLIRLHEAGFYVGPEVDGGSFDHA